MSPEKLEMTAHTMAQAMQEDIGEYFRRQIIVSCDGYAKLLRMCLALCVLVPRESRWSTLFLS